MEKTDDNWNNYKMLRNFAGVAEEKNLPISILFKLIIICSQVLYCHGLGYENVRSHMEIFLWNENVDYVKYKLMQKLHISYYYYIQIFSIENLILLKIVKKYFPPLTHHSISNSLFWWTSFFPVGCDIPSIHCKNFYAVINYLIRKIICTGSSE